MIKIPNQKTIVFGEVPHLFDGRLGLQGKISMKKLQLPHLLFASQVRGSLSSIGENQGVKMAWTKPWRDMEQWTPGWLMTISIPWGLVFLPTTTIKIN